MNNEIDKSDLRHKDEISLKEIILLFQQWCKYLWQKKWIIVVTGIVGGGLGLAYSLMKKPVYTATTTFVLESGEKNGSLGAYAGVASMMGIDLGGGGGGIFQGDNIIELYKSRTMLEKTLFSPIDSFSKKPLIERYIEINNLRKKWKGKPELEKLIFSINDKMTLTKNTNIQRLKDSITGEIVKTIEKDYLNVIKPDKKLSIIKVDVKSIDEIFAKRFNEELVKNVNDFYVQTKTKKSIDNIIILQQKTDSVRAVMNGAIYSAAAVSDATPNLNPTRQVQRIAPVQKAQFSAETNKSILGEMIKNLEMSKINLMKETPLIQVIDLPIYPLEQDKLGKVKSIVIGTILSAFLCIIFILLRKFYQKVSPYGI